jgi:hypothetical protein
MSRRQLLGAAGTAGALLLPRVAVRADAAKARLSAVVQWNAALLEGVRESKLGPPMVA